MFVNPKEDVQRQYSAALWAKVPQEAKKIYEEVNARWGVNNQRRDDAEESNTMSIKQKLELTQDEFNEKMLMAFAKELDRIEKLSADVVAIEQQITKGQTAGLMGPGNREQSEHFKAFMSFARRGDIQASMSVGSDPDGGYALPQEIDDEIDKLLLDQSPMRRICKVVPISTPDYHKLVNLGGTTSGWVGETDARPGTNTPTLAKLTPYMGEIYANPAATQQSLDDLGFDVAAFLTENIAEEFSAQEGEAFLIGDGNKKPKGLLTYATSTDNDAARAFGTLHHVKTADAAGFITPTATASPADCLVNLLYSVRKPYRQGSVWLMNSNTLAVVSKFKDAVNGLPIWQRGLADGQPSTLLGYPIEEDENMPDIGAGALPIAFGNFKKAYTIVDRIGVRTLRDPFTNKPYVNFYSTKRIGGMLVNSQAVKLLKISA